MSSCVHRFLALLLLSAGLGLLASACDLHPKAVPCSNAGDCTAADPRFGYCLQSHCVECLEDSGCGDGNQCKDGMCQRHCKTATDCPRGDDCREGMCAR